MSTVIKRSNSFPLQVEGTDEPSVEVYVVTAGETPRELYESMGSLKESQSIGSLHKGFALPKTEIKGLYDHEAIEGQRVREWQRSQKKAHSRSTSNIGPESNSHKRAYTTATVVNFDGSGFNNNDAGSTSSFATAPSLKGSLANLKYGSRARLSQSLNALNNIGSSISNSLPTLTEKSSLVGTKKSAPQQVDSTVEKARTESSTKPSTKDTAKKIWLPGGNQANLEAFYKNRKSSLQIQYPLEKKKLGKILRNSKSLIMSQVSPVKSSAPSSPKVATSKKLAPLGKEPLNVTEKLRRRSFLASLDEQTAEMVEQVIKFNFVNDFIKLDNASSEWMDIERNKNWESVANEAIKLHPTISFKPTELCHMLWTVYRYAFTCPESAIPIDELKNLVHATEQPTSDESRVFALLKLIGKMPKTEYLSLKAIVGHLYRLVNIIGGEAIPGIANALSPGVFKIGHGSLFVKGDDVALPKEEGEEEGMIEIDSLEVHGSFIDAVENGSDSDDDSDFDFTELNLSVVLDKEEGEKPVRVLQPHFVYDPVIEAQKARQRNEEEERKKIATLAEQFRDKIDVEFFKTLGQGEDFFMELGLMTKEEEPFEEATIHSARTNSLKVTATSKSTSTRPSIVSTKKSSQHPFSIAIEEADEIEEAASVSEEGEVDELNELWYNDIQTLCTGIFMEQTVLSSSAMILALMIANYPILFLYNSHNNSEHSKRPLASTLM